MSSDSFKIIIKDKNNIVKVIYLNGRLDESTFDIFNKSIGDIETLDIHVIIDLNKLKYISSQGIRVILKIKSIINSRKKEMLLTGASDKIIQIFSLLGLWKSMNHFASEEEALQFLDSL